MKLLPGQALSRGGRPRLDYLAVASLAFPFMVNSAVQAVLNATDTWFIGRVSPAATAAIGAVYWPVLVFGLLFGGVGLAVQTLVAQAYGGAVMRAHLRPPGPRCGRRCSPCRCSWCWRSSGRENFFALRLPPATAAARADYWFPRMLGGPLGVALWAVLGFFNGIGRPTSRCASRSAWPSINALFNQCSCSIFGMGVPGSAWATNAAQLIGVAAALDMVFGAGNPRGVFARTSRRGFMVGAVASGEIGFSRWVC